MRRLLILAGLFLAAAVAWACGENLMLSARSWRIKAIRDLQRQPAVQKAGPTITIVEDPAWLDNALQGGNNDLVMADVANANELSQRLFAGAVQTGILAGRIPSLERRTVCCAKEVPLPFDGSQQARELARSACIRP